MSDGQTRPGGGLGIAAVVLMLLAVLSLRFFPLVGVLLIAGAGVAFGLTLVALARDRSGRPQPISPRPDRPRPATRPEQPADRQADEAPSHVEADERLWRAARDTHGQVLSAYGAYELDPATFLRHPAVVDVTREPVMDFHTALARVQALATDDFPGTALADRYFEAVDEMRRAWVRCEREGRAAGTDYLSEADAADLAAAAKLYDHALATDQPAEAVGYLRKVRRTVDGLADGGRMHLPAPLLETIDQRTRRALEAGGSGAESA